MLIKKIALKMFEIFLNTKKIIYLEGSKILGIIFQYFYIPKYSDKVIFILAKNRSTLNSIGDIVDKGSYQASKDSYGLPDRILKYINIPLNNYPTYTDLFCLCSETLDDVIYIEIGVSVMKNTYQVSNYIDNSKIFCFDINPINPIIEKKLTTISNDDNPSLYRVSSNDLVYFKGDVFNSQDLINFKELASSGNIIFSDAHHSYDGVKSEYENFISGIIKDDFYIFYDDLNKGILKAFKEIASSLHKSDDSINAYSFYINGWIGNNEKMHKVGLITNSTKFDEIIKENNFPLLFKKQYF
jgi:hypothetical protein